MNVDSTFYLAELHLSLAKCLLKMSETSLKFSEKLILATEAAAQANGSVDIDCGFVEAILIRGKARVQGMFCCCGTMRCLIIIFLLLYGRLNIYWSLVFEALWNCFFSS